ncbi:hypothetical protein M409DRAFT_30226 [Zasmidium cellare ATCC 36951]|uniref:Uncharacterized protein n=1 Tax=Zasmidium cellare ATCC 36951 TaxID=1080233 RepID=A0A6A6BZ75_ZASCE|nr:uncharacterized protein M409DRAFT_30226 [Zasmidium cellare ATCC 36951]KAF2159348.1 hypothetical protein M409DRAFT_30226 [Zasmidium cellare ATCC 36951]
MDLADLTTHPQEMQRQQHEHDNKNTTLLRLSAELRNKVFALALPADQIFTTCQNAHELMLNGKVQGSSIVSDAESYQDNFSITQVCRQIRAETLKVAYASNTFVLGIHEHARRNDAERWVESRPSEALESISKVIVHSGSNDWWYGCQESNVVFDLESGVAKLLENGCDWCDESVESWGEETGDVVAQALDGLTSPKEKLMKFFEVLRVVLPPRDSDRDWAFEDDYVHVAERQQE